MTNENPGIIFWHNLWYSMGCDLLMFPFALSIWCEITVLVETTYLRSLCDEFHITQIHDYLTLSNYYSGIAISKSKLLFKRNKKVLNHFLIFFKLINQLRRKWLIFQDIFQKIIQPISWMIFFQLPLWVN